MKIVPASGPILESPGAQSPNQQSARERAVAALMGTPAQLNSQPSQPPKTQYPASQRAPMQVAGHPVKNPTSISPEEVKAIHSQVPETEQDPVQADSTEAAPAEVVESEAPVPIPSVSEEPQLSSQYAQLARKEKAFRAQQVAFKAEADALRAREEKIKALEADMQTKYVSKDTIVKDPYKVLTEQGFTPEQITNMLLNAPDPAEQKNQAVIDRLEAKIKALEDEHGATKKSIEDARTNSYTQAVSLVRNEASKLVGTDPNFEMIKATDSVEDVVELITKTFEKDGIMLTVEEAAAEVEAHLEEEALKIARLNKIQQRLKPAVPVTKPAAAAAPATPKPATTLTSGMNNTRPLTAKERAILAFKGEKA